MTNASASPEHQCPTCHAKFRRAEHLKRHSRSHSSERPFVCETCSKRFARSDILHRHEQSHNTTGDRGPYRLTTRTFRACQQCAGARQRCTGDLPCGRCSKRALVCTYPEDKKAHQPEAFKKATPQVMPMSYQGSFGMEQDRLNQFDLSEIRSSSHTAATATAPSQDVPLPSIPRHTVSMSEGALIDNTAGIVGATNGLEHSIASTTPWYNPSSYNPPADGVLNPPFAERPYVDDFTGDLPNFDDWWNPNHWIPLSIYASPYGPDLEEQFRYDAQSTQGSAPEPSLSIFQSPNYQGSIDKHQSLETNARHGSGSVLGSAMYVESPGSANLDSVGISEGHVMGASPQHTTHRNKRRKVEINEDTGPNRASTGTKFAFPLTREVYSDIGVEARYSASSTNPEWFLVVHRNFEKLCLDPSFTSTPFRTASFPSKEVFDRCITLYFEHFHKRFPVIHKATVSEQGHWLLLLAIATIGATFEDSSTAAELREAFQEFLCRSITLQALVEDRGDPKIYIPIAQARLLNLVSLTQSGLEQHRTLVPRYHAELARSCLELGLLQSTGLKDSSDPSDPSNLSHDLTRRWHFWIKQESRRRTGYLIWFIDSALAYLSNSGPICSMDDARAPLPATDELWAADSATSWFQLSGSLSEQPSLCQSIETLYLKKHVSPAMSELGHILLVHGLYQKTWETGKHLKQPLSSWTPTAKTKGFVATPSKDTFWLPSYPLYANWRNSACDCLDVLHWHASSVIARAAGVEHNAVLHLHLARIVLLTPFQEIQDLCFSLIGRYGQSTAATFYVHDGSYQTQNSAKLPQIRKITWRWLREDQHKARLAMIHAGSVFWHVRRYSSNSFFEPTAVYLASIVLWAYGSYKSAALAQTDGTTAAESTTHAGGAPEQHIEETSAETSNDASHSLVGSVNRHPQTRATNSNNRIKPNLPNTIEPTTYSSQAIEERVSEQPAYSHQLVSSSHSSSPTPSDDFTEHPQFIHLDRPCDDEMVQHFVIHGRKMNGHMSNVGDICDAPHKVLLEGAKLLKTRLWNWGISHEYHGRLKELAALRKGS